MLETITFSANPFFLRFWQDSYYTFLEVPNKSIKMKKVNKSDKNHSSSFCLPCIGR